MGVGNRPRPLAPGLARWRLSDRRRMTAARPNACHGPSVSAGAGGLDPATGRRASPDFDPGIADAAGLKGACAQPDPATHRGSPAGILPTADANDTGDAKPPPTGIYDPWGLPRTVCEDRAGYGAGQPADECSAGRACTRPGALAIRGSGALLYYPWKGPVLLWLCVTVATDDCIVIVLVKYCYVLLACL
jgi:hypothetical protein